MHEDIISRHQRALPPAIQAPNEILIVPRKPSSPLGIKKNIAFIFVILIVGLTVYTLTSVITLVNASSLR